MLIDADLGVLKSVLKNDKSQNIVSKSISSVPSPVTNLREYSYTIDHLSFCQSVINQVFSQLF